jgi:hypothetical protein
VPTVDTVAAGRMPVDGGNGNGFVFTDIRAAANSGRLRLSFSCRRHSTQSACNGIECAQYKGAAASAVSINLSKISAIFLQIRFTCCLSRTVVSRTDAIDCLVRTVPNFY